MSRIKKKKKNIMTSVSENAKKCETLYTAGEK